MNKKRKMIIGGTIIVILLVLIPVVFSISRGLIIKFASDEEIEIANQKENERTLKEKEEFAKKHKNNVNIVQYENQENEAIIPGLDEKLAKDEEEELKMLEIIKRFYPEEIEQILDKSKKEEDEGLVDITTSPLKKNQRDMYDLVLKILENENLPDDEKIILIEYIEEQMYYLEKDEDLKTRAKIVLEK